MTYAFSVVGIPKGQPRGRAVMRGKHAGVYDPGTADGWKALVREASRGVKPEATISCPVGVRVDFLFARPKSHYTSKRDLRKGAPAYHTHKPDVDNLIKALLDCLTNEGWWTDDSQIFTVVASRFWADRERSPGANVTIITSEA